MFTFLQGAVSASNATEYTFEDQNLGAADANRYITVLINSGGSNVTTIASVTVGGVSADILAHANGGTNRSCGIATAAVPTGTTGDVVVTFSAGKSKMGIALYYSLSEPVLSDSDSDVSGATAANPSITVEIDVPEGGSVLATGQTSESAGDPTDVDWTGVTEDYWAAMEATADHTGAHINDLAAETGRDITLLVTSTNTQLSLLAVSFEAPPPAPTAQGNFLAVL